MGNVIKGLRGSKLTAEFVEAFPLSQPPAADTVLTTNDFDNWAERKGYYTTNCEQATLITDRNNLRARINKTACSEAWAHLKGVAFSIDVYDHGKSYQVRRAVDAFTVRADRLPKIVTQFATTKRRNIKRLRERLNMDEIEDADPGLKMRIEMLDDAIDGFVAGVEFHAGQLDRQYKVMQLHLKQFYDRAKLIKGANAAAILEFVNSSDNDDES